VPELTHDRVPVRAVIFDLDGTLYRQAPLRRAMAWRLVRAHVMHPIRGFRTARVLTAYRRAQEELRGGADSLDLAEAQLDLTAEWTGLDRANVSRLVGRWMESAPLDLLVRVRQPGLQETLETLRAWGLRLGVLSDYRAEPKLEALGVAGMFDVVLCAQQPEIGVFKPNPRGLHVALERLGVAAGEALYVGDRADVDAATAAAARVPCLILTPDAAVHQAGYASAASLREITDLLEPA
jgi:FMN phosphatase YigB (HAD superfamily)